VPRPSSYVLKGVCGASLRTSNRFCAHAPARVESARASAEARAGCVCLLRHMHIAPSGSWSEAFSLVSQDIALDIAAALQNQCRLALLDGHIVRAKF
jgi:hypothetical protein